MDLDDIVDAWIDHAITQHEVPPPNQNRGHYNITYTLYLHILTSIEHRNLNVQNTMPKVLNMLYPGINCQQIFPILQGRLRNIMETCLLQLKEYNQKMFQNILATTVKKQD